MNTEYSICSIEGVMALTKWEKKAWLLCESVTKSVID